MQYISFCNFLQNVSFQNNSMVWDISNHSREESGRSGNLRFYQIQHRHLRGKIGLGSSLFMLFTKALDLGNFLEFWEVVRRVLWDCLCSSHGGNRNNSAVDIYYSFTCLVFGFLPMLREFSALGVFVESQLPTFEAKIPDTVFQSFCS